MEENVRKAVIEALEPSDAVSLVKQLVNIPSPEGEELECARFLYEYMRQAGIEAELQEVEEGRANVIAVVRGAQDRALGGADADGDGPRAARQRVPVADREQAERLADDIKVIENRAGISLNLPHLNRAAGAGVDRAREFLAAPRCARLRRIYSQDFERFAYEP